MGGFVVCLCPGVGLWSSLVVMLGYPVCGVCTICGLLVLCCVEFDTTLDTLFRAVAPPPISIGEVLSVFRFF